MNEMSEPDPRVFFAAERTFLAWIRTGLALIAPAADGQRFLLRRPPEGGGVRPLQTLQ